MPTNAFDDKTFLHNWRNHPDIAFRQLMDAYRDRVFLLCRRVCKSDFDAEDLAQEVFIRIWKGISRFKGESSLTTWIYRIAWNVCATFLADKGKNLNIASYQEIEDDDDMSAVHVGKPDAEMSGFESRQFVEKLFEQLPENYRLLLTLYYLQELSYEEITTVTGLPMGTVKGTLHRAKTRLREAAVKELG